jgi:predicted ATPase
MDLFRRRCENTSSYSRLLVSICEENGFSHWVNCGVILDGWTAVCAGHLDRGMTVLQEGIVGYQKVGARIWMPVWRILEAETCVKAGRDEAALRAIEQALAEGESIAERTRQAPHIAVRGPWQNYPEI